MTIKSPVHIYIQARMGSKRLPGKVLLPIMGRPLLFYQLSQLQYLTSPVMCAVLTTTSKHDDPIVSLCQQMNIPHFRGSESDVLGRYYLASKQYDPKTIIRLTADCPLIDPTIIDKMIQKYVQMEPCDLLSNVVNRTFPKGEDIEIFSAKALDKAFKMANIPDEREHVTLHFYRNQDRYRVASFEGVENLSQHRWTVDTIEDFRLVNQILEAVYQEDRPFHMDQILKVF